MLLNFINFLYATIFMPSYVLAASIITDPKGPPVKDRQAITDLITRLTQIVVAAAGIIAVAMIVWGGILYLTSGGNEERRGKGRQTLTWAIIGLIVTICAYVIVYVFAKVLGGGIS